MKILIRVDCNKIHGSGHLSRCYQISKELKKFGNEIFFLLINFDKKYFKNFKGKNIYNFNILNYTQKKDLDITQKIVEKEKIDILILDNYKIKKNWCFQIKKKIKSLVIIDDGFKNNYICDLYINFLNFEKNKYSKKLLGLKYFILNQEYFYVNKSRIIYDIFINLGTGYFPNYIKSMLFLLNKIKNIKKVIIVGNFKSLLKKYNKDLKYKVILIDNYCKLSNLISQSNICIGAGGMNLLERIYLNKENIVFACATHQKKLSMYLSKKKIIKYFGNINKLKNNNKFINYIEKINLENSLKKKKKFAIIDNKGSFRIAKKINQLLKVNL